MRVDQRMPDFAGSCFNEELAVSTKVMRSPGAGVKTIPDKRAQALSDSA